MTADKPLRADGQSKREALLATAREVFDAGGFFDLRLRDFARLAGVGTGTLYRHFPTRAALAEAVYREELTALCDRGRTLRATLPAAGACGRPFPPRRRWRPSSAASSITCTATRASRARSRRS